MLDAQFTSTGEAWCAEASLAGQATHLGCWALSRSTFGTGMLNLVGVGSRSAY
jgi:hypothetical protein